MITKEVPDSYEELAIKLLNSIPKGYRRVDIIADTYRQTSIKSSERNKRGTSTKVTIKSIKTKVPRDLNSFYIE